MTKKTFQLLFSLVILFSTLGIKGQIVTAQNERQDSTINVIAYFCKNDTMEYRYEHIEAEINDTDTITETHNIFDIQFVVRDSTSKGYEIECTTLRASFYDTDTLMTNIMSSLYEKLGDIKTVLMVDEYGRIEHIKNWKEVKDYSRKITKAFCDSLYSSSPELKTLMPRTRLESLVNMQFANEKSYISQDEELQMLFGLFGNSFNIGKKVVDDQDEDTGYPEHIEVVAGYSPSSDEYGFENDYFIHSETTTTIPKEDVKNYANNLIGLLMSDQIADSVALAMDSIEYTDTKITAGGDFVYFFNGWPCEVQQYKATQSMGTKKIKVHNISWISRRWSIFDYISDDDDDTTNM